MAIETLMIFGLILLVCVALYLTQPKKREMSATERVAYEDERGRIFARQESRR